MKKVKLGFFSVKNGVDALCHGSSLVVTHEQATLRLLAPPNKGNVYRNVYLHDTLEGFAYGGEYDFDTPAFKVLKQHIDLNDFNYTIYDDVHPTFHRLKLKDELFTEHMNP